MDSLACFYIVNEVADEIESFANSLFLHKQRGNNSKLIFGPVWDFGCSFGRQQTPSPCFIYQNTAENFKPHWLEKILQFPDFQLCVRSHWERFYADGLQSIEQYMDQWVERIAPALQSELARWPEFRYDHNIEYLHNHHYKPSLHNKIAWLQSQWGMPTGVDDTEGVVTRCRNLFSRGKVAGAWWRLSYSSRTFQGRSAEARRACRAGV